MDHVICSAVSDGGKRAKRLCTHTPVPVSIRTVALEALARPDDAKTVWNVESSSGGSLIPPTRMPLLTVVPSPTAIEACVQTGALEAAQLLK